MSELIYIATMVFGFYVVYTAEGDNIVAFLKGTYNIDLTHAHECCTDTINRIKAMLSELKSIDFKSPLAVV